MPGGRVRLELDIPTWEHPLSWVGQAVGVPCNAGIAVGSLRAVCRSVVGVTDLGQRFSHRRLLRFYFRDASGKLAGPGCVTDGLGASYGSLGLDCLPASIFVQPAQGYDA